MVEKGRRFGLKFNCYYTPALTFPQQQGMRRDATKAMAIKVTSSGDGFELAKKMGIKIAKMQFKERMDGWMDRVVSRLNEIKKPSIPVASRSK